MRLRSLNRHFVLFFQILRHSALWLGHYPLDFFVFVLSRFVGIAQIIVFWFVVGEFSDGALDTKYLMGYFLVMGGLQVIVSSTNAASGIMNKVKFGTLNNPLMKPVDTFFLEYTRSVGWRLQAYIISLLLMILGISYVGASFNWLVVIIAVVNALLINIAFNRFLACIAFYIVEGKGLKNVMLHIWGFLQGYLIPLSLMPIALQNFLFISPFAASLYIPSVAFLGEEIEAWKLIVGSLWGVGLLILSKHVWRKALRRYEGVGI